MTLAQAAAENLAAVRAAHPLIHSITNYVVMNETANLLLALGASPVMAHAIDEVAEVAAASSAVVLNIGTLSAELVDAMVVAGRAANEAGVPVVLDPVGVGFTRFRTRAAERILAEVEVAIVRGNASEIASLAGAKAQVRGVDAAGAEGETAQVARTLADRHQCAVAVTGAVDYVVDHDRVLRVANGHPLMAAITGSGCMASVMCAAFAAAGDDYVGAAAAALAAFGLAGERAAEAAAGPGSFHMRLYDAVWQLTSDDLRAQSRITSS